MRKTNEQEHNKMVRNDRMERKKWFFSLAFDLKMNEIYIHNFILKIKTCFILSCVWNYKKVRLAD